MKTFYLSFCDNDRPEGQRFLGACVVDVTQEDADNALVVLAARFPQALPESEWIAAAMTKAHREKCNPGGEVMSCEIPQDNPALALYPRNTLMSLAELEAIAPVERV